MKEIHFPNWDAVLARTDLPERLRNTYQITIRWYLSFCRRSRAGVNHESARGFIEWAQQEKKPEAWQVDRQGWERRQGPAGAAGARGGRTDAGASGENPMPLRG